jgi:putative toxin-antitoxin system antitoxin component (TIGR02293 family)
LGGRQVLRWEIKTYQDFIGVLEQGLPYESLSSVVRVIGLKENELGRFFVYSRRTLMRRARDKRFKPDEFDRLARIARIIAGRPKPRGARRK